jgi:flagellar motility protein MotE (MotC chaperone)
LTENELNTSVEEKEANKRELAEQQEKLDAITSQYEKLKTLLGQRGYTRRENTRTTLEHITSHTSKCQKN